LIKVGGKQIKRSLRTNDQALAKRRLKELREKATGLTLDRKKVDFKTIAQRWLALQKVDLKPSSHSRRESTAKGLLAIFGRESIARISQDHIERWKRTRGPELSTRSVHRLLGRGLLRASKALRKILIPRVEIEKFLRDTTGEIE
jgi:hypothetical protein